VGGSAADRTRDCAGRVEPRTGRGAGPAMGRVDESWADWFPFCAERTALKPAPATLRVDQDVTASLGTSEADPLPRRFRPPSGRAERSARWR
jgi:hypothetical protein